MTDEEIEQKFKETYPDLMRGDTPLSPYFDIWCYAIEIMEQENKIADIKAGRPQWHDLRKDPNDLPKDTTSLYLVRVYSWDFGLSHLYKKYGMYIPTVCEWNGEYFTPLDNMAYSNARNIKSCIAWKEIFIFDEG